MAEEDVLVFGGERVGVDSRASSEQNSGVIFTTTLDYPGPEFGSENRDSFEYWGPTREVTEESLVALLDRHSMQIHGKERPGTWAYLERKSGTYSVAYILQFEGNTKVLVRIPASGWPRRWNKIDAETLRTTVQIMRLISEKTCVPVPRVFAYDAGMDNEIRAPFTLISYLGGQNGSTTWNSNKGTTPKELRRQNLLRTLAQAVSGLRDLRFPKGGSLWFAQDGDNDPVVVDRWTLRADGWIIPRVFKSIPAYTSVEGKIKDDIRRQVLKEGQPVSYEERNIAVLFKLMVRAFVKATELPQSGDNFVLVHPDFDIQNLITDETGRLTGIIDWDGACCEPLQIGWTRLPLWLHGDWYPHFQFPPAPGKHKAKDGPDALDEYRNDYARYLCNESDGAFETRFTTKSHIYRALMSSTTRGWTAGRFVENILEDVAPEPVRASWATSIGEHGFSPGEKQALEGVLLKYFAPVDPDKFVHAASPSATTAT
ncbi:hypothetical protein LTR09_003697 [Extremus antarcticus]|uniref:Aminoglycoside phosphotransferase domain-containing protein n=1 Tax=Extremus antarcticus TaxID=702011 RepID=A0AAJ0DJ83_9PEZI|nr:hypothetical protein LTR09_003697 [Extremus antarcticus]